MSRPRRSGVLRSCCEACLLAVMLLAISLTFTGCSSSPVGDVSSSDSVDQQESSEQTAPKKTASDLEIKDVNDFSDGVAWVSVKVGSDRVRTLVSDSGEILSDQWDVEWVESKPKEVTCYSNGACVAKWEKTSNGKKSERTALIDKSGKEIWASDKEGVAKAEEVYGKGVVDEVRINSSFGNYDYGGYAAVEFDIDTLDYTGTLSGVIDSAGKWVVEPTPIASNDKGNETWSYHEYVMCSKLHAIVYRTGAVMEQTGKHDIVSPYSLKFDGKDLEKVNEWEEFTVAHSGMKYKQRMIGELGHSGYLDANENLVFKPDFGKLSADYHDFSSDGYAVVDLQNSGKGKCVTCIDTSGNQLFEPMKLSSHGDLTSVAFFYVAEEKGSGYYLTPQGEQLGTLQGSEGTEFCGNRAWLKIDDAWHCINETGEMVF